MPQPPLHPHSGEFIEKNTSIALWLTQINLGVNMHNPACPFLLFPFLSKKYKQLYFGEFQAARPRPPHRYSVPCWPHLPDTESLFLWAYSWEERDRSLPRGLRNLSATLQSQAVTPSWPSPNTTELTDPERRGYRWYHDPSSNLVLTCNLNSRSFVTIPYDCKLLCNLYGFKKLSW